ncbi:MAG: DNA methyltransferase, partial [Nanoarchaeota archaeon]|nr:DNA methyltransferase [Nanoarchaeota archaeon]
NISSIHGIHYYPGQLIPQIPSFFLKTISKNSEDSYVFDPFCGTGTVQAEAIRNGWNTVGVEINPIAALIAKVKTTAININILKNTLEKIKVNYIKNKEIDVEPIYFENINYWFEDNVIKELSHILFIINQIDDENIKDFFKVSFSSIIKKVSNADTRIYVPVKIKITKIDVDVWDIFNKKCNENIERINNFFNNINTDSIVKIYNKDIRNFENDDVAYDLIITSPPYIAAQKYVRSTRLEAYWLGFDKQTQLQINKNTIGTEITSLSTNSSINKTTIKNLDNIIDQIQITNLERAKIMSNYFTEMQKIIKKLYNLLSENGKFILIIGDNTVSNIKIQSHEYLINMAENEGFKVDSIYLDKILSRKLMTKRNKTANIIDYEWIIKMNKYGKN